MLTLKAQSQRARRRRAAGGRHVLKNYHNRLRNIARPRGANCRRNCSCDTPNILKPAKAHAKRMALLPIEPIG